MDTLTTEYLRKLQAIQVRYGDRYDTFQVTVTQDSYYETVLRCSYADGQGRYMADFTQCVDAEDYESIYRQLLADITEKIEENE